MKFLISYETGKDNYTIHFDKGKGRMFYVNHLTMTELFKLFNTIGKVIFKEFPIIKKINNENQ